MKKKKRWTHDCDRCVYVGSIADLDLYYCPSPNKKPEENQYLARYGNKAHEYISGFLRHVEHIESASEPDITNKVATVASFATILMCRLEQR